MVFALIILLAFITFISISYISYYIFSNRYVISRWYNRKKAILYKRRKIKQSIIDESDHIVRFNVVLKDPSGNYKISDNFDMTIPARAPFFARKKLERWLKENVTFEIIDIKLKDNND